MNHLAPPAVNRWYQPSHRGRVHADLWMCLLWDVERRPDGRWRAVFLYRSRSAANEVEAKDFPTAEAAMRAVDHWTNRQEC